MSQLILRKRRTRRVKNLRYVSRARTETMMPKIPTSRVKVWKNDLCYSEISKNTSVNTDRNGTKLSVNSFTLI